jgi:hypothetical protein
MKSLIRKLLGRGPAPAPRGECDCGAFVLRCPICHGGGR